MPDQALLDLLKQDLAEGLTYRAISAKRAIPLGTLSVWLKPLKAEQTNKVDTHRQTDRRSTSELQGLQDKEGQEQGGSASPITRAPLTQLEEDKEAARDLMRRALKGKAELTAQQTALIRLLLKDELEPEAERNPYAGRSSEELAERSLVLAVSLLGIRRVSALLRTLAREETVDLGLEWSPSSNDAVKAAEQLPSSLETTSPLVNETVQERTLETSKPTIQKHNKDTGVESIE